MTINSFLASLPALLGIAGFVIYQLIQSHQKGDPVTLKVLEKLRIDSPDKFKDHSQLNSKQLYTLLSEDNSLRSKISNQDFKLIQQALKQRFITSMVIYIICAVLFLAGVILFVYQNNKPKALIIEGIQLSSVHTSAKGIAVDTDSLKIQWGFAGEPEDISIFIENIDTKQRSNEFSVNTADGSLQLLPADYKTILNNRVFKEWNRVRVVAQSSKEKFLSKEFKLYVGLTVLGINFGEKVKIAAMIDNRLVQGYNFQALMVVWKKDGLDTISFGQDITNGSEDYPIENSESYHWSGAKITYLGPDDSRMIRTDIISD